MKNELTEDTHTFLQKIEDGVLMKKRINFFVLKA